nr:DNA-binding domain-containing protein [Parabacteroides distasonis]
MKKVLKGWLIDNSVTTDNKTDKILLLASAGSLTLDDVPVSCFCVLQAQYNFTRGSKAMVNSVLKEKYLF